MTNSWLTPQLLEYARKSPYLPPIELRASELCKTGLGRRDFLKLACAGSVLVPFSAQAALVFENKPAQEPAPVLMPADQAAQARPLKLGEIPADFWNRPRTLRLKRLETNDFVDVTYWRDGKLHAEGYWQACALLRDVRANRMTTMDPMLLDVLRGILGYYEAWKWTNPLTVQSGFRTEATNRSLYHEGAAKNSQHLYGRAADCSMQGVDPANLARLALHLRTGGVGFYPAKNFVHVDTGQRRFWTG